MYHEKKEIDPGKEIKTRGNQVLWLEILVKVFFGFDLSDNWCRTDSYTKSYLLFGL